MTSGDGGGPGAGPAPGFRQASALVDAAIDTSVSPGAVLGCVDRAGRRRIHVVGQAQVTPRRRAMTRGTVFDLASLTKPLFTTERVLAHAAAGRWALDAPLSALLPGPTAAALSAADCLAHRTFLPATHPLHRRGQGPDGLRAFVLHHDWPRGPPVYSDLNFILLGLALERLEGMAIRKMAPEPGFTFAPDRAQAAATEECPWRGRVLCGEVHDEAAAALGGAGGHAGLFGAIDAVLDAGATLLARPPDHPVFRRVSPTRSLGWEARHPGWSGGDAASEAAIGHTGFTGTGLWIDPASGRAWALLTNRIHPARGARDAIDTLRRVIGNALQDDG